MPKQTTRTRRITPSPSEIAKGVIGTARGADSRLPIITEYLQKDPDARAEIEPRLARATSRASASPEARRELELLRAEILSRAVVHHAFETAPVAQAQVRGALAEYLEGNRPPAQPRAR